MSQEVVLDNFDEIPDSADGDGFCEGERILAEDEYYKLSPRRLEIKQYFFPSKKSRMVHTCEIKTVYFKPQTKSDIVYTKMWGMHGLNVWWARDMKRAVRLIRGLSSTMYYSVVVDCGERTMKGFSVSNFEDFRRGLDQCNTSISYIADKLPDIF